VGSRCWERTDCHCARLGLLQSGWRGCSRQQAHQGQEKKQERGDRDNLFTDCFFCLFLFEVLSGRSWGSVACHLFLRRKGAWGWWDLGASQSLSLTGAPGPATESGGSQ